MEDSLKMLQQSAKGSRNGNQIWKVMRAVAALPGGYNEALEKRLLIGCLDCRTKEHYCGTPQCRKVLKDNFDHCVKTVQGKYCI